MEDRNLIEQLAGNLITDDSGWVLKYASLFGVEGYERTIKFNSRILPFKINQIINHMKPLSSKHKEVRITFSIKTENEKDEIIFNKIIDLTMDKTI